MSELNFVGDFWLPQGAKSKINLKVKNLILNLEGAITERSSANPKKICISTSADGFLDAFVELPVAVCLANNHIMDYGVDGYFDTIKFLKNNKISYFGAGKKEDNYNNPLILDCEGVLVGLMGYVCKTTNPPVSCGDGYGVSLLDINTIKKDIVAAKKMGAERIVISIHWGEEEVSIPQVSDVELAKELIECDIDMVVGHHAHCQLPVFIKNKVRIYFGLGNFLFHDFSYFFPDGSEAWAKQRSWNKNSIGVSYKPKSGDIEDFSIGIKDDAVYVSGYKKIEKWNNLPNLENYINIYERRRKVGHFRLAISRYLARPRFPSVRNMAQILKIIKNESKI